MNLLHKVLSFFAVLILSQFVLQPALAQQGLPKPMAQTVARIGVSKLALHRDSILAFSKLSEHT